MLRRRAASSAGGWLPAAPRLPTDSPGWRAAGTDPPQARRRPRAVQRTAERRQRGVGLGGGVPGSRGSSGVGGLSGRAAACLSDVVFMRGDLRSGGDTADGHYVRASRATGRGATATAAGVHVGRRLFLGRGTADTLTQPPPTPAGGPDRDPPAARGNACDYTSAASGRPAGRHTRPGSEPDNHARRPGRRVHARAAVADTRRVRGDLRGTAGPAWAAVSRAGATLATTHREAGRSSAPRPRTGSWPPPHWNGSPSTSDS
jgi:hypothetical protein